MLLFETFKTYSRYDTESAVQDDMASNTRTLLSLVFAKELKGPIGVMSSIDGFLLVGIGPKVIRIFVEISYFFSY